MTLAKSNTRQRPSKSFFLCYVLATIAVKVIESMLRHKLETLSCRHPHLLQLPCSRRTRISDSFNDDHETSRRWPLLCFDYRHSYESSFSPRVSRASREFRQRERADLLR